MKVCLIGGVNFVLTVNTPKLEKEDSIPCNIHSRIGGVAWNIALKLVEYKDCEVSFISVLSHDAIGQMAIEKMKKMSICYDCSLFKTEWTSYYCHLTVDDNNFGFNDMTCISEITPEYLETIKNKLEDFNLVFIDANLSENAIAYIANNIKVPICFDGTSTEKCIRIKKYIDKISVMKLNQHEFYRVFDISAETEFESEKTISILKDFGINKLFVTLGKNGAFCFDDNKIYFYKPSKIIPVKNTLRAGDTFMSGIISGILNCDKSANILKQASERAEKILYENLLQE